MHRRAFRSHPLRELAVRYGYHFHQEILAEREHIFRGAGVVFAEVGFHPDPQGLFILGGMHLVYQRVVDFPHIVRALALVLAVEITHHFGDDRFHGREGGGEYDSRLAGQRLRQRPFLRQVAAGGGLLIVMDQWQARVLEGQHARGHGHPESGVHRLGYSVRHPEFFLDVELSRACRELYGLVHGIYLRDAVVAGGRFYDADYVLVYLFGAPVRGDRLYHVGAGEDLVQTVFAEQPAPGAGCAGGYA